MGETNKPRLYITLQYIGISEPHWAIVLAPKFESRDTAEKDCHIFHITRSLPRFDGWCYETYSFNTMDSSDFLARVLVAKLSSSKTMEQHRTRIDRTLSTHIPMRRDPQNESTSCVWAVTKALDVLKGSREPAFSQIPYASSYEELKRTIRALGEKPMKKALKGKWKITDVNDIPWKDMRRKS